MILCEHNTRKIRVFSSDLSPTVPNRKLILNDNHSYDMANALINCFIDVACLLVCVNCICSQIVGGVELMRFQRGSGGILSRKNVDFLEPQKPYFRHSDRTFVIL